MHFLHLQLPNSAYIVRNCWNPMETVPLLWPKLAKMADIGAVLTLIGGLGCAPNIIPANRLTQFVSGSMILPHFSDSAVENPWHPASNVKHLHVCPTGCRWRCAKGCK